MDMTGEYRITAPRQKVWEALNDPEVLRQCIPGCETIDKESPTVWTARVTAKVGPVKAKFAGKVTLSDLDPPNGYRIAGEGTGGAAGFAKGGADVRLTDDGPAATMMRYTVQAHVGGKLAQIGSRLIDSTSRKMADEFFAKFAEIVGGPAPAPVETAAGTPVAPPEALRPAPSPAAAPPSPAVPPMPAAPAMAAGIDAPAGAALAAEGTSPPPVPEEPTRSALPPILWMLGLTAVVVVLLYWFASGG